MTKFSPIFIVRWFTMERNTNTLYILRFFAAIIVVLHHFCPPGQRADLMWLIKNGGDAVTFFFFISGFVLYVADGKYFANNTLAKSKFLWKRFARIYPLYLFAILVLLIFYYGVAPIDSGKALYRLPLEILCVQSWLNLSSFNVPGWSISSEFLFYLIFPFAVVYINKYLKRYKILLLCYLVVSISITIFLHYLKTTQMAPIEAKIVNTLYLHTIFLAPIFLAGVLAGKLYVENNISFFKSRTNNRLTVFFSVAAIFSIKYFVPNQDFLSVGILLPLYFVFIMAVTSFKKQDTAIFNSKLFLFLGDISYGIYIIQYPVYIYFTHYIFKVTDGYSLTILVISVVVMACITHYAIEKPFKKLILNLNTEGNFTN